MSETTIIEINGVKMEVDLRFAKRIDHLHIGSPIKVLFKEYSGYKSYPATIVGFDAYKELPTIIIAYVKNDRYSTNSDFISMLYYNNETKDVEVIAANEHDVSFEKSEMLALFDKELERKAQEIKELEQKKSYFLHHFKKYFKEI